MLQAVSLGKKGFNFYYILIACAIFIRQSECPVTKIVGYIHKPCVNFSK